MECVRNHKCTAGRPVGPDLGGALVLALEHENQDCYSEQGICYFSFHIRRGSEFIPVSFDVSFDF